MIAALLAATMFAPPVGTTLACRVVYTENKDDGERRITCGETLRFEATAWGMSRQP